MKRYGDFADEGYWIHNARSKYLFDSFQPDEFSVAYLGAPLFNFLTYLSFEILGVSFYSARIISVLSLLGVEVVFYHIIKKEFGRDKALISVLLFGMTHEVITYARWGTPVFLELFFLSLTMFIATAYFKSKYIFLSGVSYALAIMSKLSAISFIPVLIIFFILQKIRGRKVIKMSNGIFFRLSDGYYTFCIANYNSKYRKLFNNVINVSH